MSRPEDNLSHFKAEANCLKWTVTSQPTGNIEGSAIISLGPLVYQWQRTNPNKFFLQKRLDELTYRAVLVPVCLDPGAHIMLPKGSDLSQKFSSAFFVLASFFDGIPLLVPKWMQWIQLHVLQVQVLQSQEISDYNSLDLCQVTLPETITLAKRMQCWISGVGKESNTIE